MPNQLEITEVRKVVPVTKGATRAYVDVIFNNALCVKGFRVVETPDNDGNLQLWVSAPAKSFQDKKTKEVQWQDTTYVTKEGKEAGAWQHISDAILAAYNEEVSESAAP